MTRAGERRSAGSAALWLVLPIAAGACGVYGKPVRQTAPLVTTTVEEPGPAEQGAAEGPPKSPEEPGTDDGVKSP